MIESDLDAIRTETFLTNSFGDEYLYSVNHNSLNILGATELHRNRFDNLCEAEDSLFIVIGTDSGTLISYLEKKTISTGTIFILIEPQHIFDTISRQKTLDKQNERVRFIPLADLNHTLTTIELNSYIFIDNLHLVKSHAAEYAFITEYHDIFFNVKTALLEKRWAIYTSLGQEPFIKTQLFNIGENLISSTRLKDIFQGRSAIILAGGPSLDEILPWVLDNRNNLVVIAVSRICRRLLDVGLEPDFIFSIDPHQVSFDVSKEMLLFWKKSLFIHNYHVVPQLIGNWCGKSIYLGPRFPWDCNLNEESLPVAGPTVSNVALAIAVEMGFEQILLAGVDLCFSKNGYTHALGSNEHTAGPQLSSSGSEVVTNGGWMAETTSDLATAIKILSSQVKFATDRGVSIINPAKGAAVVEGVSHEPLEHITLTPAPTTVQETLSTLTSIYTQERRERYYLEALETLTTAYGNFIKIRKLTVEALHCNERLFGKKGKKRDFKFKKRMDKIERKLNTSYPVYIKFIKTFGIRKFLKFSRIDKEQEWEDSQIERSATLYYQAYRDSIDSIITLLLQSKQRLQIRIEEEKPFPDFTKLFQQWRQDDHQGRLKVWLVRNKKTIDNLPIQHQDEARLLLDEFNTIIHTTETPHMQRSREYASLVGVSGKIQMYFHKKDINALERIQTILNEHNAEEAFQHYLLCSGYLSELKNHMEEALEFYNKLFEMMGGPLIEEGLKRVASISLVLQDTKNALLALQTLASISPAYLPQYGDLLRITGNNQEALNVFLNYIEQVPNDISAMLKLGLYYRDLGIEEGATAMFEHALTLNPDNETAQKLLLRT